MKYYLEIWLRGFAKDYLRSLSKNGHNFHPHITLVRPFEILTNEEDIKKTISNFCKEIDPIPFTLKGINNFEEKIYYVPVANGLELLKFNNNLEGLLNSKVNFSKKLNSKKILHATIKSKKEANKFINIDQYMLRLTIIRNKKIWFSYDFVTKKILNRKESLDRTLWYNTVHEFSKSFNLLPTRKGYKKIG